MKKYIKPMVKWMEIESEDMIAASPELSDKEAWENAGAKGRYSSSDWDDDDYSDESNYSNPNVYGEY